MMTSLHELCEQARNAQCNCGAPPGCPCVCAPGDYHLPRFTRAHRAGLIGADDQAYIIRNFLRVVHDPGAAL